MSLNHIVLNQDSLTKKDVKDSLTKKDVKKTKTKDKQRKVCILPCARYYCPKEKRFKFGFHIPITDNGKNKILDVIFRKHSSESYSEMIEKSLKAVIGPHLLENKKIMIHFDNDISYFIIITNNNSIDYYKPKSHTIKTGNAGFIKVGMSYSNLIELEDHYKISPYLKNMYIHIRDHFEFCAQGYDSIVS